MVLPCAASRNAWQDARYRLGRSLPIMLSLLAWLGCFLLASVSFAGEKVPTKLDCVKMPCRTILPGAVRFIPSKKGPHLAGYNKANMLVGWVVLSTDVVDVPAYSGKPLVTLVGLNPKGVITGVQVIHHNEPILLVGIPESKLHHFSKFYVGKKATSRVVVGRKSPGVLAVDVISGATVTVLAQNKTILESARAVGVAEGVIKLSQLTRGHFVASDRLLSWQEMVSKGVWGRLTVTQKQMGVKNPKGNFIDLWYTIADAPQVGRSLLGKLTYAYYMKKLKPGQHLFVVLGNGSDSFKGSGYVRGGIFDRIRIEQGLRELVFRDTDYKNLTSIETKGAPSFKEGAVFFSRGAQIDPGSPYQMVFLGSRYDGKGAFHREFRQFKSTHRLPRTVYKLDGPDPNAPVYVQAWKNKKGDIIFLVSFLLLVMGIFVARRYTTGNKILLKRLHIGVMLTSFVMVGLFMRAQPSITQILTFLEGLIKEFRWELFLSEPLLFLSWIFIAIVSLIWGRGVFCGWVCPYGALTELLHLVGAKLGLKPYELPDKLHRKLRYLRYFLFVGLVVVFLIQPILGEKLAEIEPFKSTFLVYPWQRHWGFFTWWVVLLAVSVVWWRPFCRYVCPMGGALAIFGSFRFSGPKRRAFCSSCKICTKICEPKAIDEDGTIDPRECLNCMECEANYRSDEICPPLIGLKQLQEMGAEADKKRWERLQQQLRDV